MFVDVQVLGFDINPWSKQVSAVRTSVGTVQCEEVVNCGGQWARNIGMLAGVNVPLHSAEHFYIITQAYKPNPLPFAMPLFRDPDSYTYFREWGGGLCAGGFEPVCKPCFPAKGNQLNSIPDKFEFQLFQEDWDHFNVLMEGLSGYIYFLFVMMTPYNYRCSKANTFLGKCRHSADGEWAGELHCG